MTVTASNYARAANDLYQTEPWATEVLLRHFPVAGLRVWDPAAGNHMMSDVLRERGAEVFTSDIATYDRQHDVVRDFLAYYPSEPRLSAVGPSSPILPMARATATRRASPSWRWSAATAWSRCC